MSRRLRGLLITLVCALAGVAVAWWAATRGVPAEPEVTERARAAAEGLRDSHVYVDPSADGVFTEAELSRLDAAAAASDPQAFLVVWPDSPEAGYRFSSDVLGQIGRLTSRPGLYIEVSPGADLSSVDVGITGEYFSVYGALDDDGEWTSARETARLLEEIEANDGREYELGVDTSSHYWGGTGGTITAGLLIGVLSGGVAGPLILGGWFAVRRRRTRT
ncbi:hypothetical protein [Jiangella asiatica]|uniref:Uncharacterized protein n=1 Tax=Jiangella asiatica TaxID=2530372 RepID=A0A4R5DFB0_9ACTN|nr:hypothetical protein [Jiangella asiatica]TDE10630.1 hypothetical protein E1269_11160 [Jiangella asiatica]